MDSEEKNISDLLKKVFTPLLLSLGIIGNLMSIIIFSKASMKKHTTFKYLLLLSILDLSVLITGCGDLFLQVYFSINMRLINDFSCKVHSFMVIFFTQSSSMLLVCMSVDRVLVIKMKLGVKYSNPKIATKIFFIILILISILNLNFLIFNRLIKMRTNEEPLTENSIKKTSYFILNFKNSTNTIDLIDNLNENHDLNDSFGLQNITTNITTICYGHERTIYFEYLTKFFPWIDLFFYVIFPSSVMLICSIIIIATIFSTNNRLSIYSNHISRKRAIKNRQISYILLTTNFIFFLLVSPLLVLNTMSQIQENTIKTTIVYLLDYSNHGLNFIFYGITCEKYRDELFQLFNCFRRTVEKEQKYDLVNSEVRRKTIVDQDQLNSVI